MGEELHRLDVGVAVDDAAGQRRAHLGHRRGAIADARNEPGQRHDIADDPDRQRHGQPPVRVGEDDQRRDREDGDEPDRVDELRHRFAQRRSRLNDLRGDAAGEVVGKERHRLAQHVAMCLPAHEIGQRRRDRLLVQQVVQDMRDRRRDGDDERHPEEGRAIVDEDLFGRCRLQEIDDRADVSHHRDLDERDDEADDHQRDEPGPDLPAVAPVEGDERRRRHAVVMRAERVDERFESAEHGGPREGGTNGGTARRSGAVGRRCGWSRGDVER